MGMKKNRLTLPRLPRLIRARQNLETRAQRIRVRSSSTILRPANTPCTKNLQPKTILRVRILAQTIPLCLNSPISS